MLLKKVCYKVMTCIQMSGSSDNRGISTLKLWQSVQEGFELNEEVSLGSIQLSIVSMGSAFSGLSSYRRHRFK